MDSANILDRCEVTYTDRTKDQNTMNTTTKRTNDTSKFSIDTCDWPSGIAREHALDKAVELVLRKISNLAKYKYNALVEWLSDLDTPNATGQSLAENLEGHGLGHMEKAGFRAGRLGCNFFLSYTTD